MYRLLALIIIVLECFQLSAQINDEEENNDLSHSISIGSVSYTHLRAHET